MSTSYVGADYWCDFHEFYATIVSDHDDVELDCGCVWPQPKAGG